MSTPLRISKPELEKPMQASKWLTYPALIDTTEMQTLMNALPPFYIFLTSCVTKRSKGYISQEEFLDTYNEYITTLQQGMLPDETQYRHFFSSIFTVTSEALYAVLVGNDEQLIRVAQPTVQLQPHRMGYSKADSKFRSKTFGADSITWGIQFSYPQLYKDNQTQEIFEVGISPEFPNTQLFRDVQRWIRHHTIPTPFLVEGQRINIPMRIGKNCLSWINRHPQLIEQGMQVVRDHGT